MKMDVAKLNFHLLITNIATGEIGYYQLLNDEIVIGRDPKAHLCIQDRSVSVKHCSLRVIIDTATWILIKDLGSTNGTLLNGSPLLQEEVFTLKDVIEIGNSSIRLSSKGGKKMPAPAISKVKLPGTVSIHTVSQK